MKNCYSYYDSLPENLKKKFIMKCKVSNILWGQHLRQIIKK